MTASVSAHDEMTAGIRTLAVWSACQSPPLGRTVVAAEREAVRVFDAWLAQVRRDAIEPARLIHERDHARADSLGTYCPSCETWTALETALEES